jgi:hypothetical protein
MSNKLPPEHLRNPNSLLLVEGRGQDCAHMHAETMMRAAIYSSHHPHATSVHLNQTLKTSTKGAVDPSRENRRPDVFTNLKDKKTHEVEVMSLYDEVPILDERLRLNELSLPQEMQGGGRLVVYRRGYDEQRTQLEKKQRRQKTNK